MRRRFDRNCTKRLVQQSREEQQIVALIESEKLVVRLKSMKVHQIGDAQIGSHLGESIDITITEHVQNQIVATALSHNFDSAQT